MVATYSPIASAPTIIQTSSLSGNDLSQAQDSIYQYVLFLVQDWSPVAVLTEFQHLFIHCRDTENPESLNALYSILLSNQEAAFRNTLKRCCYILVNQWQLTRQLQNIQTLVQMFAEAKTVRSTTSPTLRQLRTWLQQFVHSQDYEDLRLFAAHHEQPPAPGQWSDRYHTYLLMTQATDHHNSLEQRQAAQMASIRLKNQFKFELAMYTARSQSTVKSNAPPTNPTGLGDQVLGLVKTIVANRSFSNHQNLARIFLKQTESLNYQDFKHSLLNYLIHSAEPTAFTQVMRSKLASKLDNLFTEHHEDVITPSLLTCTCNRMIDIFTSEDGKAPSALFHLFQLQDLPLTLVMLLLKLVLICPESRSHLETQLAILIKHSSILAAETCQSLITFLEVLRVTFAICCDDVEYDLVAMFPQAGTTKTRTLTLADYRLFSRSKRC